MDGKMNLREDKKLLWRLEAKCPICSNHYHISEYLMELPLVGKVIMSSGRCESCNYIHKDFRMAESVGPQRIRFRVEDLEDLNVIVVRAGSASIRIPELGVSIDPGPISHGYITTIEGILFRIKDVMNMLKNDPDVDIKEWERKMELLSRAMVADIEFTLIIEDPEGVSRIISDKVSKERLYSSNDKKYIG
jgi:zinc finger protein